jgi:hypothetical protein
VKAEFTVTKLLLLGKKTKVLERPDTKLLRAFVIKKVQTLRLDLHIRDNYHLFRTP